MKTCKKCKKEKPLTEFRYRREGYYRGACETCRNEEWRLKLVKYPLEQAMEIKRLSAEGYGAPDIARITGFSGKSKVGLFLKQQGVSRTTAQRFAQEAKHLTGTRVGKLVLLERTANGKRSKWKCQCDCGDIAFVTHDGLFNTRHATHSCGCLVGLKQEESPHWAGHGEISGYIFGRYRGNAKERNIEFNITIEHIWELFLQQDRRCALTGVSLDFQSQQKTSDGTASLDRINSSGGYVQGNVQWVHKWVNVMKNRLNDNELLTVVKAIYHYKNLEQFDAGDVLECLAKMNR